MKSDYSILDASKITGLSQKAIRRMIAGNAIKAEKVGSSYRISQESLDDFMRYDQNDDSYDFRCGGSDLECAYPRLNKVDRVNWADISGLWDGKQNHQLTFVDLFSGAGGLTKGFEMAGLRGICGLDWFDEAGQTYKRNFKHSYINGDIKDPIVKTEFYKAIDLELRGEKLNIVAGGFPCQGFSLSGNRIVEDPRNSLYKEMLEIVKYLKPDFVVCENVVGLRSMLGGRVEQMILNEFEEAGYPMNVTTLRAADYYVPQLRDRVIFVGNALGLKNMHPQPLVEPMEYKTTGEAIADLMKLKRNHKFNHVPTNHSLDVIRRIKVLKEGESLYAGYSDAWKKCHWNKPSCTIKENHGGVNIHPKLPRVLTARELARLQSFPDDFIFEGPKNKQLVQIGNAVPPLLAKAIALGIVVSYDIGAE